MTTIRCKAILLDLDGTLIDADAAAVQYWTAWAKSVGTDPEAVLQARRTGRRRDVIAAFRPGLSEAKLEEEVSRVREAALANIENVVPLPGAKRLLTVLPAGRWAIVTSNDREVALGRLRAAGLQAPDIVVAAEDVAKGKPDPEGYLTAARLLGFSASEVVVVDDSAVGIEAADAAGMRAIAIRRDDDVMHSRKAVSASVNNLADVTAQADNGDVLLTISPGRPASDGGVTTEGHRPDRAPASLEQRLEEVKWHLVRYDNLRISLASRGALILSADALIAAGATVLAGQTASRTGSTAMIAAVAIICVLSLLCVGVSVTYAARAIVNIRPWRSTFKENIARSIFFDASDTVATAGSAEEFENLFRHTDKDAVLRYAIIDLWKCIGSYKSRYGRLRISLQFLLLALWIFLTAVVLQFAALPFHL